jgi:hypothetical protein
MATYKKGFKKQTSEQMLLQVIVGIIVSVILFVLIAFIYDISTRVPDYSDYTKITKYEDVFTQKDKDGIPIEQYIVYFYKKDSEDCNKIAKNGNVFIVCSTDDITDADTNLDDFLDAIVEMSMNVPLLLTVIDGEPADVYIGGDSVIDAMISIQKGTYEPFN